MLPLSEGQIWVTEEGELLLQTAHTKGQIARREDEEDYSDKEEETNTFRCFCKHKGREL